MSKYFEYLPKIKYGQKIVCNITRRNDFINKLYDDPKIFLPLTLNDGEKPEDIAYLYYGSVAHTNFILMMNGVYDVYTEWLMPEDKFRKYIALKYKEMSGLSDDLDIIAWTMKTTLIDNIKCFVDVNGNEYSVETALIDYCPANQLYRMDTEAGQEYILTNYFVNMPYTAYRYYDYEYDMNESKRTIFVIDKEYIDKIIVQFRSIMGEE